jgi:hypothetical protein
MLRSVSMRRLPAASGISSVRSSWAVMKPGGPPRGEASQSPCASALAIMREGAAGEEGAAVDVEPVEVLQHGDARGRRVDLAQLRLGGDGVGSSGRSRLISRLPWQARPGCRGRGSAIWQFEGRCRSGREWPACPRPSVFRIELIPPRYRCRRWSRC